MLKTRSYPVLGKKFILNSLLALILFTSCDNFMKGSDIVHDLEQTITYATAPYAVLDISIKTNTPDSMVPAAGNYNNKYKAGDSFNIKVQEKNEDEFIRWVAVPSGSVNFKNDTARETTVTIMSTESAIEIYPLINRRGQLTVDFFCEHGSTIPGERKYYYKNDEFNLSYKEDPNYAFVGWEAESSDPQKNIDDIIKFKGTGTEVTVQVLDVKCAVKISAKSALRPKVSFTLPQNGEKNIVRNRTINIIFTKEMKDEAFEKYINVYEGVQRIVNNELIYESTNISKGENKKVILELGESRKTLRISLADENLYSSTSYISVEIDKNWNDTEGACFAEDYKLQFQTSSYIDSIAPSIKELTAGFGTDIESLDVKNSDDTCISLTDYPQKNCITDGQLNFYIVAEDMEGAKGASSDVRDESKVKSILYRISKYNNDENGKLSKDATFSEEVRYLDYKSTDFADMSMEIGKDEDGKKKTFKEITDNKTTGCLFTYDLGNLASGIYRFDIATEDSSGNNGFDDEDSDGKKKYKSVFVIKDNTPVLSGDTQWITTDGQVDSEYNFCYNETKQINTDRTLCIPYSNSYTGIKTIELSVTQSNGEEISDVFRNYTAGSKKIKYGKNNFNETSDIKVESISKNGNEITLEEPPTSQYENGCLYLDNLYLGELNGTITIQSKLTDNLGKIQANEITITAFNDQKPPVFKNGINRPIVADASYTTGNVNEHIFPRKNKPGLTGADFYKTPEIINGDDIPVRWFYTNAKNSNTYGIYLKSEFIDDNGIEIFVKKVNQDTSSDDSLKSIKTTSNLSGYTKITGSSYFFETGTWNLIAKDNFGNTTKAYTFVVVQDHKKPVVDNIRESTTVELPAGVTISVDFTKDEVWKQNNSSEKDYTDLYGRNGAGTYNFVATRFDLLGANARRTKLTFRITGSGRGLNNYGGTAASTYVNPECYPSRDSSGLGQWNINYVWACWNCNDSHTWVPIYPAGSVATNKIDDYEGVIDFKYDIYCTRCNRGPTTFPCQKGDGWKDYTPGTDISFNLYHDWANMGDNYYERLQPFCLFLKDNCGNLNFVKIDNPKQDNKWNVLWQFK